MTRSGSNVLIWPLQAQAGLNDGHTVCAHSWSHRAMAALSNEQVFAELCPPIPSLLKVLVGLHDRRLQQARHQECPRHHDDLLAVRYSMSTELSLSCLQPALRRR
jgi:peptidoglycan/xylan/chitin deacetylase (PgdA/CDA1 family)